jgi:hypothetical protein
LFAPGSPAAISRLIVAIIVDAIDGMLRGRLAPHIGNEILVTIAPAITNCDAPATVVLKILVPLVVAAGPHVFPTAILSGRALPFCVSVTGDAASATSA